MTTEFPALYNVAKNSKIHFWKIYVKENLIYRESWYEEGKIVTYPVIECNGKNKKKSNATSDIEQALIEAKSKWVKQFDKGYKVFDVDDDNIHVHSEQKLFPMLAQQFNERKHYLHMPCAVSRKLDGVRMMSKVVEGNVVFTSRTFKEFKWMNRIREHVSTILTKFGTNIILDGELYSHNLPFNELCGAVRSVKCPSVHDNELEYWIFDIADENLVYNDRIELLFRIKRWYEQHYSVDNRRIKFEMYEILNDLNDYKIYHDKYVAEGFEGLIVRNLNGFYKFKFRSNDLQKYKDFEDAEFEIIDFKTGTGTEKNAIIYICKYTNGQTFDVRPRGSIEDRIRKAKIGNTFIGKKLIVRYQPCIKSEDKDKDELPRFPVGVEIRDYE